MNPKLNISALGAVLSDESRLAMISALLDGRALTANELAHGAGITPQTATFHLKKLAEAGLVQVSPKGRHRFFTLTSPDVSELLRTMMKLAPDTSAKPAAKRANDVCFARTCYGHLAGALGIALAEAIEDRRLLRRVGDEDYALTRSGQALLDELGIDVGDLRKSRRRFASQCLDWSERRPHVGGAVGFALMTAFKNRGWVRTKSGSREVVVTRAGHDGLRSIFGIDVEHLSKTFFG